jgi:hypothetical protein
MQATAYLTLMVIDQDHYVSKVAYGKGSHTLTRDQIGTRYVFAAVRILVNPTVPDDFTTVHALQDAVTVSQQRVGRLELPAWDAASQKKVREALLVLSETLPDLRRAGGGRDDVELVRHLIGTASAWGLNPERDAIYLNITPSKNDGAIAYTLTVNDVPVDGFWSITVYDATGHFQKNSQNAYSLNNLTAKKGAAGSATVQFDNCDGKAANCLPIMNGGTTWCDSIVPAQKSWTAPFDSPRQRQSSNCDDVSRT